LVLMGLMLLLCGGLLVGRSWMTSQSEQTPFEVVEVRGEVPNPGFHAVPPPVTIAGAVSAAGGHSADSTAVPSGSVVRVGAQGVEVSPMDKRLVFGLPISLNSGTIEALRTVPGIGPTRAEAIVQDRTRRGPFQTIEDLTRVRGVGDATVERIRPFVTVQ
jgi:competence protein ComEA